MQIAIIIGSHRSNSQSTKVGKLIAEFLSGLDSDCQAEVIDLSGNALPLWDEEFAVQPARWQNLWRPIQKVLQASDAIVVVTPEWAGMVPPGLKNFLLLCTAQELGDKPGLIVSVSAGAGGAYPVAELRMSGYKNNFICWIPHHIVIRQVESVLNAPVAVSDADSYIRERLRHSLRILLKYAEGLRCVRASGVVDRAKFPNGM